jgi:hypothetical protein
MDERKQLRALKAPETPDAAEARARVMEQLQGVRKALAAVKTSVQFTEPKSTRSRRTIALPAVAIRALKARRVRQLQSRLVAGGQWQFPRHAREHTRPNCAALACQIVCQLGGVGVPAMPNCTKCS